MAGLSSLVLGTGLTALQQEHTAWITQRQMAQQAKLDREALEARYAHEQRLAEQEAAQTAEQEKADRLVQLRLLQDSQASARERLRAEQDAAAASTSTDVANTLQQLKQAQAAEERTRLAALRKAMSKHRASLGARNLSSDGGTAEAILLGLVKDSDAEAQSAAAASSLQEDAVRQKITDLNRKNLLQQSNLAEQQRLQLLSLLG